MGAKELMVREVTLLEQELFSVCWGTLLLLEGTAWGVGFRGLHNFHHGPWGIHGLFSEQLTVAGRDYDCVCWSLGERCVTVCGNVLHLRATGCGEMEDV